MEFNYYNQQINELNINRTISTIKDYADSKLKSILKSSFDKLVKLLQDNNIEQEFLDIINKQFKMRYKSLKDLQSLKESNELLNEDWKNFLKFWKSETYPALSIFPTLQIWFQIDKLLDGANITDLDWKKIAVYGVLWIIIITGQHALLWQKWKRENQDEWEAEGKPGIFRRGKR